MPDQHKNFAYSTVATAPSPASSGTSVVVASGHGARFPAVPFNATVWPIGQVPTPANAEIVRVTAISTDTLTLTRTQEGTSARSIIVGDQISAAITLKTLTDIEGAVSEKNVLMNGGFDFAQRQTPGTLTSYAATAGRSFAADRWGMSIQTSSLQYRRTNTINAPETGLAHAFYGTVKQITAAGKFLVTQVLDANTATAPLRGRTLRLQAKMKRSGGSITVKLGVIQLTAAGTVNVMPATFVSAWGSNGTDPTLGTNLAFVTPESAGLDNTTISGSGAAAALTTAWARYSAAFVMPTDCKNILAAFWSDAQLAVDDQVMLSEVGLYDGADIVDWVPFDTAQEFLRCRRFYQKTFLQNTAPAQNVGVDTGEALGIAGVAAAGSELIAWRYPAPMVATPAVTLYNPAAANAQVRNETAGADHSASAAAGITTEALYVTSTGAVTGAIGDRIGVHIVADAEL